MWDALFGFGNALALLCWGVLVLGPRGPVAHSALMYLGTGLLCLCYAVLMLLVVSGALDPVKVDGAGAGSAGFTSIEGVRAIFLSDGGVTIGWLHYLALDLFAGLWIARDADSKGFARLWQAPVLVLTFLAGPIGLLIWLAIREPAARRMGKPRSKVLK